MTILVNEEKSIPFWGLDREWGTGARCSQSRWSSWLCWILRNQYCGCHPPGGAHWRHEDEDLWRQAILACYPGRTGWTNRHSKFPGIPEGQGLQGTAEQSWVLPWMPRFDQGATRCAASGLHCPSYTCLMVHPISGSTPSLGPQELTGRPSEM